MNKILILVYLVSLLDSSDLLIILCPLNLFPHTYRNEINLFCDSPPAINVPKGE